MFSEKFNELNNAYVEKVNEGAALRKSIELRINELNSEKENIRATMAKEFIDNFSGSKSEVEYLLSEQTSISSELFHFSKKFLATKGFKSSTYNNKTWQKNLEIDISEKEDYLKAIENIDWALSFVLPVENIRSGKFLKLIELSILGEWDFEKLDGKLCITDGLMEEGDPDYKVILIKYNDRIQEICRGNDLVDMIENKVIPMLNHECYYSYEDEEEEEE